MPERQNTKKYNTPQLQGQGSFVTLRQPTYGAIKAMREAIAKVDDAEAKEALASRLLDEMLVGAIVAWNWVDDAGEALAQPSSIDDLDQLTTEEINWLRQAMQGNSPKK